MVEGLKNAFYWFSINNQIHMNLGKVEWFKQV